MNESFSLNKEAIILDEVYDKLLSINADNFESNKDIICKSLQNGTVKNRVKVIQLIAEICEPSVKLFGTMVIDLAIWHCEDSDCRVKNASLKSLFYWVTKSSHSFVWNPVRINAAYFSACNLLNEDIKEVRLSSMYLISSIACVWPKRVIPKSTNLTLHGMIIADDAFTRVCEMMQDSDRTMRESAAYLLSDMFEHTSEANLMLTLDKTVLSERKFKLLSQKPNNPALEEISFKVVGCSGALICGLEDDYHEVRKATLKTITKMAHSNCRFAIRCQDIVVEMLTDSIKNIRLEAIRTLSSIGSQVPLRPEQIGIITGAMCEDAGRLRRRLHALISRAQLASAPCVLTVVDALLRNLKRYPQDKHSIWRCAAHFGMRNSQFVELSITSLLHLHPFLMIVGAGGGAEEREDPAYLTVLLVVFNAAGQIPGIRTFFNRPIILAEAYLRELVPWLMPEETKGSTSHVKPKIDLSDDVDWAIPLSPPSQMETKRRRMFSSLFKDQFTKSFDEKDREESNKVLNEQLVIAPLLSRDSHLIRNILNAFLAKLGFWLNMEHSKARSNSNDLSKASIILRRLVFEEIKSCAQKPLSGLKNFKSPASYAAFPHYLLRLGQAAWHICSCVQLLFKFALIFTTNRFNLDETKDIKSNFISVSHLQDIHRHVKLAHNAILRNEFLVYGFKQNESQTLSTVRRNLEDLIGQDFTSNIKPVNISFKLEVSAKTLESTIQNIIQLFPDCQESCVNLIDRLYEPKVELTQPYIPSNVTSENANFRTIGRGDNNSIGLIYVTPVIASAAVKVRASVVGMTLEQARSSLSVFIRRPDMDKKFIENGLTEEQFYFSWNPPHKDFYLLDEQTVQENVSTEKVVEMSTWLELTSARASQPTFVEICLGFRIQTENRTYIIPLDDKRSFRLVPKTPCTHI